MQFCIFLQFCICGLTEACKMLFDFCASLSVSHIIVVEFVWAHFLTRERPFLLQHDRLQIA